MNSFDQTYMVAPLVCVYWWHCNIVVKLTCVLNNNSVNIVYITVWARLFWLLIVVPAYTLCHISYLYDLPTLSVVYFCGTFIPPSSVFWGFGIWLKNSHKMPMGFFLTLWQYSLMNIEYSSHYLRSKVFPFTKGPCSSVIWESH